MGGKYCVYIYRDPRPDCLGAPIYVGKGTAKRPPKHWRFGRRDNPLLDRVLKKLRSEGLTPEIEIVAWFDDEAAAFALEKQLIVEFGRRDQGLEPLANLTDGGEGHSNPTPETRRRLATAAAHFFAGRPKTAEQRAKMSAAATGKKKPRETGAKRLAKIRGRPATAEARANMSAAGRGKAKAPAHRAKLAENLRRPEVTQAREAGYRRRQQRLQFDG